MEYHDHKHHHYIPPNFFSKEEEEKRYPVSFNDTKDDHSNALHVKVGAGRPVRIHVSRKPMSNMQALTEALHDAKQPTIKKAKKKMKEKCAEEMDKQEHRRAVDNAMKTAASLNPSISKAVEIKNSKSPYKNEQNNTVGKTGSKQGGVRFEPDPFSFGNGDEESNPYVHKSSSLQKWKINSSTKTPFYPPPNKTHGRSRRIKDGSSYKPTHSLKQGNPTNPYGGAVDVKELNEYMSHQYNKDNMAAELDHYKQRVHALEDEMQIEKANRDIERSTEEILKSRMGSKKSQASNPQLASISRSKKSKGNHTHKHDHLYYPHSRPYAKQNNDGQEIEEDEEDEEEETYQGVETLGDRLTEQDNLILKRECARMKERIDKLEKDASNRESRIVQLKEERDDAQRITSPTHADEKFKSMKRELAQLQHLLSEKKRECARKDEQLARLKAEKATAAYSIHDFRSAISDIEGRASGDRAAMKRITHDAKTKLRECENALRVVDAHNRQLQEKLHSESVERNRIQKDFQKIKRALKKAEAAISDLNEQLTESNGTVSLLEADMKAAEGGFAQERERHDQNMAAVQATVLAMTDKLKTAEELAETRRVMFEQQGGEKDHALMKASATIDSLHSQLEKARDAQKDAETTMNKTVSELMQEKKGLLVTIEHQREATDDLKAQIAELKNNITALQAEVNFMGKKAEDVQLAHASLKNQMERKIEGERRNRELAERECDKLQHQISDLNSALQRVQGEVHGEQNKVTALEAEIKYLKQKVADVTTAHESEKKRLEMQCHQIQSQMAAIRASCNTHFSDENIDPFDCC
eukprot:m.16658 g.16658  ORF g.16658 m.16658 type:complete len:814 (+) comp4654_c0_seq1:265-2706(+)